MKLIAAALLFISTTTFAQVSLIDAVRNARAMANTPICIPHQEYWQATATIFTQLMEIGVLRQRIAALERQLGERK